MQRIVDLPGRVKRGVQMKRGRGWRLTPPSQRRGFKATLLTTCYVGDARIAVFRVVYPPEHE